MGSAIDRVQTWQLLLAAPCPVYKQDDRAFIFQSIFTFTVFADPETLDEVDTNGKGK
jgi:hypothetical protein